MRGLVSIASISLGIVAAGCSGRTVPHSPGKSVPVVVGQAGRTIVPAIAFNQLIAEKRKVVGETGQRVFSIDTGLPEVRRVSQLPIVAATEQEGWLFYATGVVTDATTHQPVSFISGYAVARGDRQIISWSVW